MVMKYACSLFICKNTLITSNAISILTLSEGLFTNKLSLLTIIFPFASNTHTPFFFCLCEDFHMYNPAPYPHNPNRPIYPNPKLNPIQTQTFKPS